MQILRVGGKWSINDIPEKKIKFGMSAEHPPTHSSQYHQRNTSAWG